MPCGRNMLFKLTRLDNQVTLFVQDIYSIHPDGGLCQELYGSEIAESAAINNLAFFHIQKLYGADHFAELVLFQNVELVQEFFDKLRTIITVCLAAVNTQFCKEQSEIVIMIFLPVHIHIFYILVYLGIFILAHSQTDNHNFAVFKPLHRTEMNGLFHKSADERVAGENSAERIHLVQVVFQTYGRMGILIPRNLSNYFGNNGIGCADNYVNMFFLFFLFHLPILKAVESVDG